MPKSIVQHASRYLYASEPQSTESSAAIADAMEYRDAEHAAERDATDALGLTGLDLLAVRYLLQARRENREFTQTQLGIMLDLTSAAITKLITRLADDGWVTRIAHPSDRRAHIVAATPQADERMTAAYHPIHQTFVDTFDRLDASDIAGFRAVIQHLTSAIQQTRQG